MVDSSNFSSQSFIQEASMVDVFGLLSILCVNLEVIPGQKHLAAGFTGLARDSTHCLSGTIRNCNKQLGGCSLMFPSQAN